MTRADVVPKQVEVGASGVARVDFDVPNDAAAPLAESAASASSGPPSGRYTLFVLEPREKVPAIYRQVIDLWPGEQQVELTLPALVPILPIE